MSVSVNAKNSTQVHGTPASGLAGVWRCAIFARDDGALGAKAAGLADFAAIIGGGDFDGAAHFVEAGTDAWADAVVDGDNVFDMSQLWGAVVNERVVKAGDRELAGV